VAVCLFACQRFEHWLHSRRRLREDGVEPRPFHLELLRSLAVLVEGLLFTGPGLHYLYTALEK
jgi:hypothetical protein